MEKTSVIGVSLLLWVQLACGCSSQGSPTVVIDGYTHNSTLSPGGSVLLGTQLILVCQVVGLPYGTPLSYTWTCPNGPCEVEGYYGRKIYNDHILAVNTTSTSDGGTYTCQVTATGGQEANWSFTLTVTGGSVVHSEGRLIPHEFPITDLQQISGPDGNGRINCTISSGTATFFSNGGQAHIGGVTQTRNRLRAKATMVVDSTGSFQNRGLYCTNATTNFFYLFISSANPLSVPKLTINTATSTSVEYRVERSDNVTTTVITGYEVFRFGVPMIGEYVNAGSRSTVTISPAVPGAQYRITAWALDSEGRRSATPTVKSATTGEARPWAPRSLHIPKFLTNAIELNWLPPTEPNGEVHYVIYYTPEGDTEQSIDTGSNLTHYNLTGLERNRVYTNIAVQAVNSAGMSDWSAVIAQCIHTASEAPSTPSLASSPGSPSPGSYVPPGPTSPRVTTTPFETSKTAAPSTNPLLPAVISLGMVVLLLITCVALLVVALAVTANKLRQATQGNTDCKELHTPTGGIQSENESVHISAGRSTTFTHAYYNYGGSTAQREEGTRGAYAQVCTEGLSVVRMTSLRASYQELDPKTMDMNEYQKMKWGTTTEQDIH